MLNDYQILILGGDSRYLHLINYLANHNAKIIVVGYDEHMFDNSKILSLNLRNVDFTAFDAIVLPILGTHSIGTITPTFSEEEIYINADMINKTKQHCVIFTGTSNTFLNQITERTDRQLVTLFDRDNIAILNSIPTAEATLKLAIEHTDFTIHQSRILILGFGRVGKTTARLFKNVGSDVSVAARTDADFARMIEMGITPVHIENLKGDLNAMQIIINTIPHLVLTRDILRAMNKSSLIIDLASAPGGTNFTAAKDYGIQALHALGLPGKTAPATAGKILAQTIIELLPKVES